MKYIILLPLLLLTACSLSYEEVSKLKSKCESLGGSPEFQRFGPVEKDEVSEVWCRIDGVIYTTGHY